MTYAKLCDTDVIMYVIDTTYVFVCLCVSECVCVCVLCVFLHGHCSCNRWVYMFVKAGWALLTHVPLGLHH